MVLILIESSDAFRVDDKALERFLRVTVQQVDWLVPYPETLGARVDCGTDAEARVLFLVEQDSI